MHLLLRVSFFFLCSSTFFLAYPHGLSGYAQYEYGSPEYGSPYGSPYGTPTYGTPGVYGTPYGTPSSGDPIETFPDGSQGTNSIPPGGVSSAQPSSENCNCGAGNNTFWSIDGGNTWFYWAGDDGDGSGDSGGNDGDGTSDTGTTTGPPTYSVFGKVWLDANGDGAINSGESGLEGEAVYLQNNAGTANYAGMYTNSSGSYLFTGYPTGSDYRVTHAVPAGYVRTTDDSVTFSLGPDFFHNFGVKANPTPTSTPTPSPTPTPTPIPAWFQTNDGDVGSRQGISLSTAPPAGQFNAQGGVVTYGGSSDSDFKVNLVGGWEVSNHTASNDVYNYEYFNTRLGNPSASLGNSIDGGTSIDDSTIYKTGGTTTVSSSGTFANFNNKKVVILVPGDLVFANTFNPTNGSIVFIVSGSVRISPTVGTIRGIILANGNINTCATTSPGDCLNQLVVNGSLLSYGGLTLARRIDPSLSQPSEIITYQPTLIRDLTELLGNVSFNWQEVAP